MKGDGDIWRDVCVDYCFYFSETLSSWRGALITS